MSRKCAVCGGETTILKNEHNRVVDFRLCGGECREKWFKWKDKCKTDSKVTKKVVASSLYGGKPKMVVFDEFNEYEGMMDAGDV